MMPQCDPLSPGFFTIVLLLLHLWTANISLNGCLERTDTMLSNGLHMVAVSWALYFAQDQRGFGGQVHYHI